MLWKSFSLQNARRKRGPSADAVRLADVTAAPERYVGKAIRLYDVTFVSGAGEVPSPPAGHWMTPGGAIEPVQQADGVKGKWYRLAFLDVDGTPSPEAYEQFASSGRQPIRPGETADVYARLVRLKDGDPPVLLCEKLVPQGRWSGPPAPGFDAACAVEQGAAAPAADSPSAPRADTPPR